MKEKRIERQISLFNVPESKKISSVIKRDGRVVSFDKSKIINAIFRAAQSVQGEDRELAERLADNTFKMIHDVYPAGATPSVEEIQDIIEKVLIENGHAKTAKAYILYRAEHQRIRLKKDEQIVVDDTIPYKVLWKVFLWNVDHQCHTVDKINTHIKNKTLGKLIQESEKAYHDEIDKVSALILKRLPDVRLVVVAGPSSSGKTTTTTKISEKLKEKGVDFVLMNLDNYFLDLDQQPRDEYGDYDFEKPEALDLDLINEHLESLLDGKTIQMPYYNFKSGKREKKTQAFRLLPNQILLIDSLHGLYEGMTSRIPPEVKFKFYIEALCQIKNKQGEFVRWADLRMLRRMVRDNWHRSYDPISTIGHWHYVRRSEMRYIVPFVNSVDYIFNGSLPYELPFYKLHLLGFIEKARAKFKNDSKKADAYLRSERVYHLLSTFLDVKEESLVPDNSLLREFIGGSKYQY